MNVSADLKYITLESGREYICVSQLSSHYSTSMYKCTLCYSDTVYWYGNNRIGFSCHDPPLWMYWLTCNIYKPRNTYMYYWLETIHLRRPQKFWDFCYPPSLCLQPWAIQWHPPKKDVVIWPIPASEDVDCWGPGLIMNCRCLKPLDLQLSAIDKPRPSPLNGWSPISKSTQRLVTNVLWYSLVTMIIGCGIFWGECKQEQCAHVLTVHITCMHAYY